MAQQDSNLRKKVEAILTDFSNSYSGKDLACCEYLRSEYSIIEIKKFMSELITSFENVYPCFPLFLYSGVIRLILYTHFRLQGMTVDHIKWISDVLHYPLGASLTESSKCRRLA